MSTGSAVRIANPPVASSSSKLPSKLRFPLAVLLSFSASYVLLSITSVLTRYELSSVSRSINDGWQIAAFPAWRIVELAVGWFAGYDDYDMASLTLQTRLPYFYLLTTFYGITLRTSGISLALDVISASLPFYLLRRRLSVHAPTSRAAITNKVVVTNWQIFALTTVLGAVVYSVVVYASFITWLPVHLVTYFDNVRSLEAAHGAQIPALTLTFVPLGWAASTFLFAPSTAAQVSLSDVQGASFNPATASLRKTIQYNVWGWNRGTKVAIGRVAVLATMVGLSTSIRVWGTIEGSEGLGAAGWASVWVVASVINGAVLRWVGNV